VNETEFVELFLQITPKIMRGHTYRFVLVRTDSTFIIPPISESSYLDIRTVPVHDGYKLVVTSFTHSQYEKFKRDFSGQLDFLRIPHERFLNIVNFAIDKGFSFHSFTSVGRGKIHMKAKNGETSSWDLYNEMMELIPKGFDPYILEFQDSGLFVSIRSDFNFFATRINRDIVSLTYSVLSEIISSENDTIERYANFIPRPKNSDDQFVKISPLKFYFPKEPDKAEIIRKLERFFRISENRTVNDKKFLVIGKKEGKPEFFVTGSGKVWQLFPAVACEIEPLIVFSDVIRDYGGSLS
jgi:hypothetical protein